MRDVKLIWESYQRDILNESKIEIIGYNEDSDDYDPWEIADKVEAVFKKAGIHPSREKNINYVAMIGEEVVGATYVSTRYASAEEFGGPEEKNITVYEFDIAVDPKYQGGTVGYLLTKACVEDAKSLNYEMETIMHNRVINPKMAQMLERLFNFEYLSEDDRSDYYNSYMIKVF